MTPFQPLASLLGFPVWAVALAIAWSLVWKGLALWRAALLRKKGWFIALLIVNTMGILEIIFLLITRKSQVLVEVIEEN